MQEFIESIAEILEMDESEITQEFNLKESDNWDSLAQLSLLMLAEDDYDVTVTDEELKSANNVLELYQLIQTKVSNKVDD